MLTIVSLSIGYVHYSQQLHSVYQDLSQDTFVWYFLPHLFIHYRALALTLAPTLALALAYPYPHRQLSYRMLLTSFPGSPLLSLFRAYVGGAWERG